MDPKKIYQHYEVDEHIFIDRIFELIDLVSENYYYTVTEFLNPRQVEIVRQIGHLTDVSIFISSDFHSMEYSRVIIAPDYYQLEFQDFEIALIEMTYSEKFKQINHPQILGTLIHQLGLKRSIIGDIIVSNGKSHILIAHQFLDYILTSIKKVSSVGVSLKEISIDKLMSVTSDSNEFNLLSSSMRIDKIIAILLKLPRNKALKLIETGKVKLNFKTISKVSEIVTDNTLISVSGFGRFLFIKNNGLTKNGKFKLVFSKEIKK